MTRSLEQALELAYPAPYGPPNEARAEILALADKIGVAAAARATGWHPQTLYNWRNRLAAETGSGAPSPVPCPTPGHF